MCKRLVVMLGVLSLSVMLLLFWTSRSNSLVHAQTSGLSDVRPGAESGTQPPPSLQAIKFLNATNYRSGGSYATSVAVGDLNGDGHPDVVVANSCENASNCSNGGGVSVLLGYGDGTLQAPVIYSSGGVAASSVAIADVNGDGRLDVVVANECLSTTGCDSGGVTVLLGNGDGTFQSGVSYPAGYGAASVAIGDVNGDGRPDLVVANQYECSNCSNGGVSVLLGNGDGTFQAPATSTSGGVAATAVKIADVNGDGHPDLVISNQYQCGNCSNGEVSVLLNKGNGTFQAPIKNTSGGYAALSVAIGDVNADGRPDVIVTNLCANVNICVNGVVGVLLGNGDGTFQLKATYSSAGYGASSVAIGDLDGDKVPDLVVDNTCRNANTCTKGGVAVLAGNGDGTFRAPISYKSGGEDATSVALTDLNDSGRLDVITSNYCASKTDCSGTVAVLLNGSLAKTTTSIASSLNPSIVNQSVTFKATIISAPDVPDGEVVTFSQGKTILGTATTSNGSASLTTTFSKTGTFTIKASYPGDAFHKTSSGTVKQVVN
jgi:hypothetical protein